MPDTSLPQNTRIPADDNRNPCGDNRQRSSEDSFPLLLNQLIGRSDQLQQIVARHRQGSHLQQQLDQLSAAMQLPFAVVTPAKKPQEFILQVNSAAEATVLRNQIPALQLRLQCLLPEKAGTITLRVRNRPSVMAMQREVSARLQLSASTRRRLQSTLNTLTDPGLRASLGRLLEKEAKVSTQLSDQ